MTVLVPTVTVGPSEVRYGHLVRLSDEHGVFEHARGDEPRIAHGYCVDDVARALIVATREPHPSPELRRQTPVYLRFLEQAVTADGRAHNRMDVTGVWTDQPGVGDWWGRALWALGTLGARDSGLGLRARRAFTHLARQRSNDVRAMAFAAIGAGELAQSGHRHPAARKLLADASEFIPTESTSRWGWCEPTLRYANAAIAEAVLVIGRALSRPDLERRGIELLSTLVEIETRDGHLSVTSVFGRGPDDPGPRFDQQPIEPAHLADAAARAYAFTGQNRWREVVELAWAWFLGDNDNGTAMIDLTTGAGFDGLMPGGRNENRGAESTLAALSTWQHARRLGLLAGRAG